MNIQRTFACSAKPHIKSWHLCHSIHIMAFCTFYDEEGLIDLDDISNKKQMYGM
jgi:hypothetical protein